MSTLSLNKKATSKENVLVCVRMRPMNRLEQRTNQKEAWVCEGNAINQTIIPRPDKPVNASREKELTSFAYGRFCILFLFALYMSPEPSRICLMPPCSLFLSAADHVFGPDRTNNDIYEEVGRPIVEGSMEGFHGTFVLTTMRLSAGFSPVCL